MKLYSYTECVMIRQRRLYETSQNVELMHIKQIHYLGTEIAICNLYQLHIVV